MDVHLFPSPPLIGWMFFWAISSYWKYLMWPFLFRWNTNHTTFPYSPIMIPRFSLYMYCLYLVYECPMKYTYLDMYTLKGGTSSHWTCMIDRALPTHSTNSLFPYKWFPYVFLTYLYLVYGCPIMHGCFLRGNFLPLNMHDVALPTHSVGIPTHYSL